jgi:signal transduction histidine kinase
MFKNRGTELGLSICKKIIEKLGGNLKVQSEGEG